jgi:hypothetical protein
MSDQSELDDLAEYLVRTTRFTPAEVRRLVAEVLNFLDDTPENFVRRRHLALRNQGLGNSEIFLLLLKEVRARRFRAPEFTERQIRRIIYG